MTSTRAMAQLQVRAAQAELNRAQGILSRGTEPWREAFQRHRGAWIAAGGFLCGITLGSLPRRAWASTGAVAGSAAALIARSLLTPMITSAIVGRQQTRSAPAPTQAAD